MKEEEVDQYFKNKFDGFAPAPAADAWARLQTKLAPPPPKRNTTWVYLAAAAVTVLLLSGGLFFRLRTTPTNPAGNLARHNPVLSPLVPRTVSPAVAAVTSREEAFTLPATLAAHHENQAATSAAPSAPAKPAKKRQKIRPGILIAASPTDRPEAPATAGPLVAAAPVTALPVLTLANNPPPARPANVLEVVIKKDAATTVALADDAAFATASDALRDNLAKKGKLFKNILKQARNLKNGEKVELSTLGLNANYRIDVESKILKQKYTKVINL